MSTTITQTNDEFLREKADRIRARMTRSAQDIVEIGLDLIAVKDRVGHGNFLPWIEREFAMSDQSAANFMNVARRYGDQIPNGLEFQSAVLYALAAPSMPEEVRTEVTERVAAGETVTVADVREAKEAVRHGRQKGRGGEVSRAEVSRAADRRMVTGAFMEMLDLFEQDGVDPTARAAFIVERLDKASLGKLKIKRLLRSFEALKIVFHDVATDLYETRRAAREGRPAPATRPVVR